VAWFSAERWEKVKEEFDASIAPEICVEILSPSNANAEIEQKKQLYFEAGATEVWTWDAEGTVQFFHPEQAIKISALVPDFPTRITL
jgi:Uma2 family endonuclease